MIQRVKCFFAYPANPSSLSEVIENAIVEINNQSSGVVYAYGWKSLGVTGKVIAQEVCTAIDQCDLLIGDMTILSPNVLFEIGYAIARDKRLWLTLDPSFEEAKVNYDRLNLFGGVGYAPYQNRNHLVSLFFREKPFEDLGSTIFANVIQSIGQAQNKEPSLLYLKSRIETEASIDLSRRLAKSKIPLVIDDPQENNSQPLTWYAQNVFGSLAVVAHLLDDDRDRKYLQSTPLSAEWHLDLRNPY